jgi:hypothetical protein
MPPKSQASILVNELFQAGVTRAVAAERLKIAFPNLTIQRICQHLHLKYGTTTPRDPDASAAASKKNIPADAATLTDSKPPEAKCPRKV